MRVIEQTSFLAFINFPKTLILWVLGAFYRRVVDLGKLKTPQEGHQKRHILDFRFKIGNQYSKYNKYNITSSVYIPID